MAMIVAPVGFISGLAFGALLMAIERRGDSEPVAVSAAVSPEH